jgi:pyruvate formate lyase activating enzyme
MLFDASKCVRCGACAAVCPAPTKCVFCGKCVVACPHGARAIAGKEYTVGEVVRVVMQDEVFYQQSGGGATLSGGEPLLQIDFAEELLRRLKAEGVHTAVDTCGAVPFSALERAARLCDLFLYDIKLMDDESHRFFTGVSNRPILENLKKLAAINKDIHIRMPIVEGVNADRAHIEKTLAFLDGLGIRKVSLLPYHDFAAGKYARLNRIYEGEKMGVPAGDKMEEFRLAFEHAGYQAGIGG